MRRTTNHGSMVLKHYLEMMPGTLFPNLPEMEAAALDRLVGHDVASAARARADLRMCAWCIMVQRSKRSGRTFEAQRGS